MNTLKDFSPQSRVWVYQSDRAFSETETAAIGQKLELFVGEWAAHGRGLKAWGGVLYQHFIVLVVDERQHGASGCSIDSSVRVVKEIETEYGVSLFNRLLVAYKVDNSEEVRCVNRNALEELLAKGEVNEGTVTFNNLVQSKEEWERAWEIPLRESWVWKSLVV